MKWWNVVINITPHIFLTPPYTFIPRKCKKKLSPQNFSKFSNWVHHSNGEREREREGEGEREGRRKRERERAETMYNQITFMFSKEHHGNILSY